MMVGRELASDLLDQEPAKLESIAFVLGSRLRAQSHSKLAKARALNNARKDTL